MLAYTFVETDCLEGKTYVHFSARSRTYRRLVEIFAKEENDIIDFLETYIVGGYDTHQQMLRMIDELPKNFVDDHDNLLENISIIQKWCSRCKDEEKARKFIKLFDAKQISDHRTIRMIEVKQVRLFK